MRLFEEIFSSIGVSPDVAYGGAKFVVYAGKCACFENVAGISYLSKEEIGLLLKKGEVRIFGKDLHIERYGMGDLVLTGQVEKVEMGGGST